MERIITQIEKEKLIVIVRGVEKEKLIPLTEALYKGGIRFLELTFSSDGKVSDEETAERIKMLSEHFKDRMCIGAGTVITEKQVELTAKAKGKFIISPDTDAKIIKKTKDLGLISMPGALTPTEIKIAHNAGADFVKVFPVSQLGSDYIKAVRAPLSHIKLLAVGGIDSKNMFEYLKAGACGFGIGSNIINKEMLDNNDFEGITKLAEEYKKGLIL